VLWPLIKALSECRINSIKKKFIKVLEEYRYGVIIRSWIQSYLEVSIAVLVQLWNFTALEFVPILNFVVALVFGGAFMISPWLIIKFIRNKSVELVELTENSAFYKMFGSLFYEFKVDGSKLARYFYIFFVLRRLIYSLNLIFMGSFPFIQSLINTLLSLGFLAYLGVVKPHVDVVLSVSNIISEVGIFLVFGLVTYFLQEEQGYKRQVESAVFYITLIVILVQTLACVIVFIKGIVELIRFKKENKVAEVVPQIHEVSKSDGSEHRRVLDFFRGRRRNQRIQSTIN